MDDFEKLRDGIGAMAEITLMFWNALISSGADEDTAVALTNMFLNAMMYFGE